MRRKKRCHYCPEEFFPHPRLGNRQVTCGKPNCIHQHKLLCHKRWKRKNREAYRDNQRQWRTDYPRNWKQYRVDHPEYKERNIIQTKIRKSLAKGGLQKRIDILQPLESYMEYWNFSWFAKSTRWITALLFAYSRPRTETHTIIQVRDP